MLWSSKIFIYLFFEPISWYFFLSFSIFRFFSRISSILNSKYLEKFNRYPTLDGEINIFFGFWLLYYAVAHGTWKKFSRHSTITEKKYFLAIVFYILWFNGQKLQFITMVQKLQFNIQFLWNELITLTLIHNLFLNYSLILLKLSASFTSINVFFLIGATAENWVFRHMFLPLIYLLKFIYIWKFISDILSFIGFSSSNSV